MLRQVGSTFSLANPLTGSRPPYLLGGRQAGQGAEVGGVGDHHGLGQEASVSVLGNLRLVPVES